MQEAPSFALLVGLGFLIALVAFLMAAFFRKEEFTQGQFQIVRLLASLCAGFGAGFLTGELIANGTLPLPAGQTLTISATAGLALFIIIWFTFNQTLAPPDAYNISIPDGVTFRDGVDVIAAKESAVAEFDGFNADETSASLNGRELHCKSPEEALSLLRNLAKANIRAYDVKRNGAVFTLKVK